MRGEYPQRKFKTKNISVAVKFEFFFRNIINILMEREFTG